MASSSTASSTAVLVAGSALLAAAGLGYLAASTSGGPRAAAPFSDDDEEEAEITAAEVCEIYAQLLAELRATRDDLVRRIAPYQRQRQQQLRPAPAAVWRAAVAAELERAVRQHRARLLEERDIDPDCWEAAVRDLLDHPDSNEPVRRAVTKFQLFWQNCADELFPNSTTATAS